MHIDLFGPTQKESVRGKKYNLVCVNDYPRYTWIDFLKNMLNAYGGFRKICFNI